MELSAQQETGRQKFLAWYRSPHKQRPFFFLTGVAGSGKSTCVKAIVDGLKGQVLFAAPTGKAALVLGRATGQPAQTIHSLIYKPLGTGGDKAGIERLEKELKAVDPLSDRGRQAARELKKLMSGVKPLFTLNLDSKLKEASLLVCDEVSMCSEEVINDLLSFGVPMLVIGDPFQLPPVGGKSFFKTSEADVCLTEIHRQAKDSPIIYLATLARQGKPLPIGRYGESEVTNEPVSFERAAEYDQILSGTHEARHIANNQLRKVKGFADEMPMKGDKVMCKHNNANYGLMNGAQFIVDEYENITATTGIIAVSNEDMSVRVVCHREPFVGQDDKINPWDQKKCEKFHYGYCGTVHSAQGSQWNSVFILDESRDFGGDIASKLLYTAITRAAERVLIKRYVRPSKRRPYD